MGQLLLSPLKTLLRTTGETLKSASAYPQDIVWTGSFSRATTLDNALLTATQWFIYRTV
ncbi:hypothetical protein [Brasilonema bromeliae]|uniref:hypothetical protein n=1 Tax=Brasilonema bromeliae TaxID=383615 RepID=UPI00145F897C|nr:hypothetical protein [Brasilonema bromeliae]